MPRRRQQIATFVFLGKWHQPTLPTTYYLLCTKYMYSRGFQIDDFVFQTDLNFANLKGQLALKVVMRLRMLIKPVCSLILQKWGRALEKRLGSIIVDLTPPNSCSSFTRIICCSSTSALLTQKRSKPLGKWKGSWSIMSPLLGCHLYVGYLPLSTDNMFYESFLLLIHEKHQSQLPIYEYDIQSTQCTTVV